MFWAALAGSVIAAGPGLGTWQILTLYSEVSSLRSTAGTTGQISPDRAAVPSEAGGYRATKPPSTAMAWPVTKLARSEKSHTTTSAISSGRP